MRLLLIRHARAFERDSAAWPDDSRRPLTASGRRRFLRLATLLGKVAGQVDRVESSRFTRAWQTSLLLEEAAKWPSPSRLEWLEQEGDGAIDSLRDRLRAGGRGDSLAWVGHEPQLGRLASALLCGDPGGVRIRFRKGAAMQLEIVDGDPVRGRLEWMLHPAWAIRR
jgi:phosphohistidine phosphatase